METLYAISIRQPWIDMILRGEKSIEIRNWEVRRRGLIALHSSWRIDFSAAHFFGYQEPWRLPRGRVLGVAEISEVVSLDGGRWRELLEQHRQPLPYFDGTYGVTLRDVRALKRPVAHPGKLYFFPLSESAGRRVREGAGLSV